MTGYGAGDAQHCPKTESPPAIEGLRQQSEDQPMIADNDDTSLKTSEPYGSGPSREAQLDQQPDGLLSSKSEALPEARLPQWIKTLQCKLERNNTKSEHADDSSTDDPMLEAVGNSQQEVYELLLALDKRLREKNAQHGARNHMYPDGERSPQELCLP